jgi:competence protein ComEA
MKKLLLTSIASLAFFSQALFAVNVNTADAPAIAEELNGVGTKKAQAIVDYRTENGDFKTIESLTEVKGIGLKTVEKNRENIQLAEEQAKSE